MKINIKKGFDLRLVKPDFQNRILPKWKLPDGQIWVSACGNMSDLEASIPQTVGSLEMLWEISDTFRFSRETGKLETIIINIPEIYKKLPSFSIKKTGKSVQYHHFDSENFLFQVADFFAYDNNDLYGFYYPLENNSLSHITVTEDLFFLFSCELMVGWGIKKCTQIFIF